MVLNVVIFYKNPRSSSLVMKNNLSGPCGILSKTNVVYEYRCTSGDCAPRSSTYIGYTTCSLSRRLSLHLQHGAIKQHQEKYHSTVLDRETIVNNTRIVTQCNDLAKLRMLEAVYIRERSPTINIQANMTTAIPLFNSSTRHKDTNPSVRNFQAPTGSPPPPPQTPSRPARRCPSRGHDTNLRSCLRLRSCQRPDVRSTSTARSTTPPLLPP